MKHVRRFSKKYYFRQMIACFLVCYMFLGMPVQIAQADPTPLPGSLPYGILPGTSPGVSTNTVGSSLNVYSNPGQTVINWRNFDIGQGAMTNFYQGNGWVLNNVKAAFGDGLATGINGMLTAANCGVIVVNPRGIVFGPSALVNAKNFVASGLRMDVGKFLSGQYEFTGVPGREGLVTLEPGAQINVEEIGALIGKKVLNMGTISAGPDGCVIMAAADKVVIGKSGGNVFVHPTIWTDPSNRVVDNGGYNGTGPGTIDAPGADVILTAGDIWSTAIEGVGSLSAVSYTDVHLQGDVTASDEVVVVSSLDGDGGNVYVNGNIEAGEIILKAGDISAYEASMSRVQVADGKTLTSNDGHIWIEAVHDVILGGAVDAATDLWINADKQGNDGHGFGGDLWAKGDLIAGGQVGIWANGMDFDGDVRANGGDLRLVGRTSYDNPDGHVWRNIDVASGGTLYALSDIAIVNLNGPAGMTLTGHDSLSIIAGGTIYSEAAIGVTGSSLLMQQGASLNTKDYTFFNQGTTDLTLISDNGSVTSDNAKVANAADKWQTIGAQADNDDGGLFAVQLVGNGDITTTKVQATNDDILVYSDQLDILATDIIKAENGNVFVNAGDNLTLQDEVYAKDSMVLIADGDNYGLGDVLAQDKLTTENGDMAVIGRNVTLQNTASSGNNMTIIARPDVGYGGGDLDAQKLIAGGTIELNAEDTTIKLHDDVTAGVDILLNNNTVADDGVKLDAGQDVTVADGKTLDGEGALDVEADRHITLGGAVTASGVTPGDLVLNADAEADGVGSMWAKSSITNNGGNVDISGRTVDLDGAVSAGGNLTVVADEQALWGSVNGNVTAKGTLDAGGNIDITADDHIYLQATPKSADAGGNMTLVADNDGGTVGNVDVEGNLLAGGNIDISASDNTIFLGGDVKTTNGNIIFNNNVVADGSGSQIFDAGAFPLGFGKDLIAHGDITKTTSGDLTLAGGRGTGNTDYEIFLNGNVTVEGGAGQWGNLYIGETGNGEDTIVAAGKKLESVYGDVIVDDLLTGEGALTVKAARHITLGGATSVVDGDLILNADAEADGVGNMWAKSSITNNGGNVDISGRTVDLDGAVSAGGNLTVVADEQALWGSVNGNVTAKSTLDAGGNIDITADDHIDLQDDAQAGGNITLAADADGGGVGSVDAEKLTAGGTVDISASDNTINLHDDVIAGVDILLNNNTVADDGVKLDAGQDIHLDDHKTMEGKGNLTLEADRNIYLGGDLTVGTSGSGSLWLYADRDYTTWPLAYTEAKGNIIAKGNITVYGDLRFTGADGLNTHTNQLIQAENGNLDVDNWDWWYASVQKTSPGNLEMLAGSSLYARDVTVDNGKLNIGAGYYAYLYGNLWSKYDMTVTSNMSGSYGEVRSYGNMTSQYGNVEIKANGDQIRLYNNRSISAGEDILLHDDTYAYANRYFYAGDDVVLAGGQELRSYNNALLYLQANDDIMLGVDNQSDPLSGYGGNVTADGSLTLDAGGSVYAHGDLYAGDDMDIYSSDWTTYLYGNAYAADDLWLHNNTELRGCGDQTLEAGDWIRADGYVRKCSYGDMWMLAWGSSSVTGRAIDLRYNSCGPTVSTCMGNLWMLAPVEGDIQISGDVTTFGPCCDGWYDYDGDSWCPDRPTGGVAIVSMDGKIYTEGGDNDTLNVSVTGNSDHWAQLGVYDPMYYWLDEDGGMGVDTVISELVPRVAIAIVSAEDLKLGPDAELTAYGRYYTDVDDRGMINFLDGPASIPPGYPRDPGSAFDLAIYVESIDGDVDVSCPVEIMSREWVEYDYPDNGYKTDGRNGCGYWECVPRGTMVIDAWDTVTFGPEFECSLADGEVGDRLEVCSRRTEWLNDAIGRLPYVLAADLSRLAITMCFAAPALTILLSVMTLQPGYLNG